MTVINTKAKPLAQTQHTLTPITITAIDGAIKHSSDFSYVAVRELTDVVVRGSLDIPDQDFMMPVRRDDGRLCLFSATVSDGQFSVTVNFPTSGEWSYTEKEANRNFPEPRFSLTPIVIDVIR